MKLSRFTLIELLVVMAVIGILVGIAVPAVGRVVDKGRQTQCKSNLHQLQVACATYESRLHCYPSWLSNLYPNYLKEQKIFVCPSDPKNENAVRPTAYDAQDKDKIKSAYDDKNTPYVFAEGHSAPNGDVERVSYVYEFCGGYYPAAWTSTNDGTRSWQYWKLKELKKYDSNKATRMPMIRCFWHITSTDLEPVLNVSSSGNVYWSKSSWENGVDI